MNAIDPSSKPVQSFDWGVIKWYVTPDDTEGANVSRVGDRGGNGERPAT